MRKSLLICSLALGAATIVGCKDDETKPTAPAAGSSDTSMPAMKGPSTQPSTPDVTIPTVPATTPSTPSSGTTTTTPPAVGLPAVPSVPGTPASADVPPEAQTLMDKVKQAIKDNKLDDADADLKKLEGMKDKLPASVQQQITAMRTSLDASKATGGVKLPGLPGTDNK